MITNTATQNPILHLLSAMGGHGGVEDQERQGQQELVRDQAYLPISTELEKLVKFGLQIGAYIEGDPLFVNVILPTGWKIVANPGSFYWSTLEDQSGKEMANIFYKAAFYDRDASIKVLANL